MKIEEIREDLINEVIEESRYIYDENGNANFDNPFVSVERMNFKMRKLEEWFGEDAVEEAKELYRKKYGGGDQS